MVIGVNWILQLILVDVVFFVTINVSCVALLVAVWTPS